MIAGLKPYAEYKESGVSWLGKVPKHWVVGPGFAGFREKRIKNTGMKLKTVLSLSYGRIVVKPPEKLHGLVPESFETYQIVEADDIIIRSTDLQNDWNSKRVGLVRDRGIITSAYLCFVTSGGLSAEYGYQILNTFDLLKVFYGLGSGLRQNLEFRDFKRMRIFIPPPDEQAAIVRFLDWANGRLERAIRAKRKVIALLGEQKQAIIHRAVTRGLDPTVPLKPTGIPWLGDIPHHWEVQRLGRAIRLLTGFPFASSGFVQGETGVRLVRGINVTPSGLRWDAVVRWKRSSADGLDEFELKVGDIVLGMDRPIISSGVRAAAVEEQDTPSLLLQRVARLRPTARLDARFLLLLLRGRLFANYVAPIFTGISVPHLSPEQIKGFIVALPTIEEQRTIVSGVETETSDLNAAISRVEREIELLGEYCTRLVADVVTGKLDVREAASHLPDEPAYADNDESDDLGEADDVAQDLDAVSEEADE